MAQCEEAEERVRFTRVEGSKRLVADVPASEWESLLAMYGNDEAEAIGVIDRKLAEPWAAAPSGSTFIAIALGSLGSW